MATINRDKAFQFVQASGDPVLSALAAYAIGEKSAAEALQAIQTYQRPDGGWTKTDKDFQGDLSVISTTWVALQWLIWLGGDRTPALERTLSFLRTTQNEAGYWDEPEAIRQFNPPFWMLPGSYPNQLWFTSAVCCKLKELGCEKEVNFEKALEFLRMGWDGVRYPVFVHTHWMVMPLLSLHDTGSVQDKNIILGCKTFLQKAIESSSADPGDLNAVAYASRLAGDIADDLYHKALQHVLNNQADDGGWITHYPEKHRPAFTVEALFLLKKLAHDEDMKPPPVCL
ncbi:MAG: hypothetical protein GYA34_07685 [Chloroflexi bacterium]|nr:hypothetical protein [Chloroflexota bacterium]